MIALSLDDCEAVTLPKRPGTFYVRPLSERVWRQFLNIAGDKFGMAFLMGGFGQEELTKSFGQLGDAAELLLRYGFAGWRDVPDHKGTIVPFEADDDGGVDIEPLCLNGVERIVLFSRILMLNMFSEEEEKNSSEPLSSTSDSSA